jgi:hypothetical protein
VGIWRRSISFLSCGVVGCLESLGFVEQISALNGLQRDGLV